MIAAIARCELNCIAFIKRELAPTQARWHSTIRLTITSVAILMVMQIFRLGEGYWAIITMVLMCGPNVPSAFRKGLARIVGTTVGVLVGYTVYTTFFQQPWFLIPAIFACIMLGVLVIVRSDTPYVGWVFALTVLIVVGDSHRSFDSISTVAFEREWVVGIGVALSWFAMKTIFPTHALATIRGRLEPLIAQTRVRVAFMREQLSSSPPAHADLDSLPPAIDSAQIQDLLLLLRNLIDEKPSFRVDIDQLTDRILLLESISGISSSAIGALKTLDASTRLDAFAAHVGQVVESLDTLLIALAHWANQLDWQSDSLNRVAVDFSAVDHALAQCAAFHDQEIARLGIQNEVMPQSLVDPPLALARLLPLMALPALVRAMRANYYAVSFQSLPDHADGSILRKSITRAMFGLGLRGDAPRGMSVAVRTAIACTIGWIFVTTTGYDSLGTMMVTPLMIIGSTGGSVEATLMRARLRFLGGFAGAIVGVLAIVFVMPTITSLVGLIFLWVICAAPFLWIVTGSPRISHFGFQGLFCVAVMLLGSFAPTVDMTLLGGRVTGILLGVVVTYIVFGVIAPDYGRNELLDVIASALRRIGTIVRCGFPDRPISFAQLNDLRYRIYALVLRMRVLAASLDAAPDVDSPGLTPPQVERVEAHLVRLLATVNAIATNRLSGAVAPEHLRDIAELAECADAIERGCIEIADAIDSRSFDGFDGMLAEINSKIHVIDTRLPEIRLRPSVRILGAEAVERIIGQIGLYHVAHARLHELIAVLADIHTANQRVRASQRQYLPAHSAHSSTA